MKIFKNIPELQKLLEQLKNSGNITIGFVPTMGALHEGHLKLITKSKTISKITVCSIFVNPTQFNNKEDLEKYPRVLDSDIEKLESVACDILFCPDVEDIYPDGQDLKEKYDLLGLDKKWEGEFRPGHFDGVVQVVKRLLDIVKPDYLVMGQKDFQQFTIISILLKKINSSIKLIIEPTMREKSGLAMSSRNERLTNKEKETATILYKTLEFAKNNFKKISIKNIEKHCIDEIENSGMKVEYFKIVSEDNLEPVFTSHEKQEKSVAIVAAWMGKIRLIDNMILN